MHNLNNKYYQNEFEDMNTEQGFELLPEMEINGETGFELGATLNVMTGGYWGMP